MRLPRPAARTVGPGARRSRRRARSVLAAGLAAAAAGVAVAALAPAEPAAREVLVAARDLPAGSTLGPADVRVVDWPAGAVPGGTLTADALDGVVLATGLREGEAVTDTRTAGPGLLAGQAPGTVAVSVGVDDPLALTGVTAGTRVDVLVRTADPVTGEASGARPVARDVVVLALDPGSAPGGGLLGGAAAERRGILVAVDAGEAAELAGAAGATSLAVRAPA